MNRVMMMTDKMMMIAPYVELTGTSYVQSTTGLYCTIEYSSRGWISGERNHFKCYIRRNSNPKEYVYKIEGQWSGKSTLTPFDSKSSVPFLDVTELTPATMHVEDVENQDEMESRKIWQKVSDAIRANDTQTAGIEKTRIENKQREERTARLEAKKEWEPKYFDWVDQHPTVTNLQRMLTSTVKGKYSPATSGNWVIKE